MPTTAAITAATTVSGVVTIPAPTVKVTVTPTTVFAMAGIPVPTIVITSAYEPILIGVDGALVGAGVLDGDALLVGASRERRVHGCRRRRGRVGGFGGWRLGPRRVGG